MKKLVLIFFFLLFSSLFFKCSFCQQSLAEKYYDEALGYFKLGEYEKVIILCKKAIDANPKYLDAYLGMGRVYFLLKQPKEATAIFRKMLAIDSKSGDAYFGLGEIYWKEERNYQKAINAYKKALEVEPNNANNKSIYVSLAGTYEELKIYQKCFAALEKAKKLDPDYGDVYAGFGSYYSKLNKIEKAKENYKKAIAIYRIQGFEDLVRKYEEILKKLGEPYVRIYFKSGSIITGYIIEETDDYYNIEGDFYNKVAGGFVMGVGGENRYKKTDIGRIETIQE